MRNAYFYSQCWVLFCGFRICNCSNKYVNKFNVPVFPSDTTTWPLRIVSVSRGICLCETAARVPVTVGWWKQFGVDVISLPSTDEDDVLRIKKFQECEHDFTTVNLRQQTVSVAEWLARRTNRKCTIELRHKCPTPPHPTHAVKRPSQPPPGCDKPMNRADNPS